jgi:hypothetical protein
MLIDSEVLKEFIKAETEMWKKHPGAGDRISQLEVFLDWIKGSEMIAERNEPYDMRFSERHFLGKECEKWMDDNNVARTPEGAYAYLAMNYYVVPKPGLEPKTWRNKK